MPSSYEALLDLDLPSAVVPPIVQVAQGWPLDEERREAQDSRAIQALPVPTDCEASRARHSLNHHVDRRPGTVETSIRRKNIPQTVRTAAKSANLLLPRS